MDNQRNSIALEKRKSKGNTLTTRTWSPPSMCGNRRVFIFVHAPRGLYLGGRRVELGADDEDALVVAASDT